MVRCFFTGEELGPDNREEHTIQRALGGRIRSRIVSSTAFNQRCGQLIDPRLNAIYAETMSVLGPVLPVECLGGTRPVEMPGHRGRYGVDNQGRLVMRRTLVEERDPVTNRPTAVIGNDEAAMRRIIEQNIQPGAIERRTEVPPPSQDVLFGEIPVQSAEIEIAALKATLLSFDHLLGDDPNRFTRSPTLEHVREFVRSTVMDDANIDPTTFSRIVLGLQYDQGYPELYAGLRQRVDFRETPFEHVLLASANPATQTLDVVFWVFRTDPFAFRLCNDWRGEEFTYVVANGVLRETTFSEAIRLNGGHDLGTPNLRRSYVPAPHRIFPILGNSITEDEQEQVRSDLFDHRAGLYRDAVDYVERHCDGSVIENLSRYARLNENKDHRISTAIHTQLGKLFDRRIRNGETRGEFDRILADVAADAPDERCQPQGTEGAPEAVNWPLWVDLYRRGLDALREPFGLPGEIYSADGGAIVSEDPSRSLGELPM
jgi:hypothetical protein